MSVGIGEETPFFIEAEPSGMVRRTVRKVRETRRNLFSDPTINGKTYTTYWAGHAGNAATATLEGASWAESGGAYRITWDTATSDSGDIGVKIKHVAALVGWDEPFTVELSFRVSDDGMQAGAIQAYSNIGGTARTISGPGDQYRLETGTVYHHWATVSITEGAENNARAIFIGLPKVDGRWVEVADVYAYAGARNPDATFFSGDTPDTDGWEYRWEGAPNNSTSIAERVEYVYEYGTIEEGAPRVNLSVYNVPTDTALEIRWRADGEEGVVQGLKSWRVSDVGLETDWAAPLNREIIYTVFVDGDPQASTTLTVHANQSWIQDPLHPDTALPVKRRGLDTGHLTLEEDAAKSGAYPSENTQTRVLGSKYPRFSGSMRGAAADVNLNLFTPDIPTTDDFAQMLADTPILLFRPHERMRPFPGAAYLAADIIETPIDQDDPGHQDGGFTKWEISGNLVQAVMQAVQSGYITYQDVQDLLGGYTYGEVQTLAASTLYLDWQRNPLIFTHL